MKILYIAFTIIFSAMLLTSCELNNNSTSTNSENSKELPGGETNDKMNGPKYAAAQEGLAMLKELAAKDYAWAGFSSAKEVNSSVLGTPISVHFISLEEAAAHDGETDPNFNIDDSHEWMYPVEANGVVKSAVVIHRTDGQWSVAEVGNANMIQPISLAKERHISASELAHEDYILVTVPALYHYWLGHRNAEDGRYHFTHIWDHDDHDIFKAHETHPATDILSIVRDIAQNFDHNAFDQKN